jgi:hypothetical protein
MRPALYNGMYEEKVGRTVVFRQQDSGGGLLFKTTVVSGSPCQDMHVATSVYRLLDNQTLSSMSPCCVSF